MKAKPTGYAFLSEFQQSTAQQVSVETAQPKGFREARAVVLLAALDLHHLGHELPVPAMEVGADGFLLCLEAETGAPLLLGRDAVIGDELALRNGRTRL